LTRIDSSDTFAGSYNKGNAWIIRSYKDLGKDDEHLLVAPSMDGQ